jgi:hypothetical protein
MSAMIIQFDRPLDQPQINADRRRYKHQELTQTIVGVFYEVRNELGHLAFDNERKKISVHLRQSAANRS